MRLRGAQKAPRFFMLYIMYARVCAFLYVRKQ